MNAIAADAARSWAPAHVPEELLWDHDVDSFTAGSDDPFVAISRVHDGPPIIWARGMMMGKQPGWVPISYQLISEVLRDTETFSSVDALNVGRTFGFSWRLNPIEYDPPEHTVYRNVLQPLFRPPAIAKLDAFIRQIARETIAEFENDGSCEFIGQFAKDLPTRVFLEMMGLPREKAHTFLDLEETFFRAPDPAMRGKAASAIIDVLKELVADRQISPREDIASAILAAEVYGRPLNTDEIIGMVFLLYIAGLDTVLSSSGWHMNYIATHPELQARLRENPKEISGTVEDMLRAYGVLRTQRRVTKDVEFHGVPMKAGDPVVIAPFLASRDLTFSIGPRNCLGAHLARRELTIIAEEFLSRFSDIRVPAGEKASWQLEGAWSVTRLPLELSR